MYSRNLLLSALLVIGAETYAKNNKTEVESLLSYHNSVKIGRASCRERV